uniref:Uncharacterized protein n=1 Tax=Fagus sylvatica TaxID=28930 RepID=A0A2N9GIH1_FAGSY
MYRPKSRIAQGAHFVTYPIEGFGEPEQAGASGLVVRSASLCQEQPHLTYTQRREYKQKEVTPQPEKENPRPTLRGASGRLWRKRKVKKQRSASNHCYFTKPKGENEEEQPRRYASLLTLYPQRAAAETDIYISAALIRCSEAIFSIAGCHPQQGRVLLEMYPAPSTAASILVLLLAGRAALAIVARVLFSYWLLVSGF